ncbi:MAG: flagellar hook-basal body complex protein FliE [Pseudomonadota bacterium]
MSTSDPSRMLLELRAPAAEAPREARPAAGAGAPAGGLDFGQVLKRSIDQVNGMQSTASALAVAYEQGAPGVDLTRVMLESNKAGLAFRAMSEVRNRLVNAYQEVMNMPI